jgi:uncharacterized protein YbjT (DUF2867 family)
MKKILVTGAAGNIGTRLLQRLAGKAEVRAFVRPGERVAGDVERFEGDLADRERVRSAVKGVSAIYLLTTGADLAALEANVIDAAAAERVLHVVKHSILNTDAELSSMHRWHRAGEQRLEASGLAFTILRPAVFATNALGWAGMAKGGAVYGALGDAALPVIDPDDVAEVAAKVLTEPGHAGKAYALTGPEALTEAAQVATIARVIGKPLQYVAVPDEAARQGMLGLGWPAGWVDGMVDLIQAYRRIGGAATSSTVSELLGRPPGRFDAFITAHAALFR